MDKVIFLDSIDSTNNYLKKLACQGAPCGQIVFARSQTSGRGRLGRSFASPAGTGIYLSWLIRPNNQPKDILPITCKAAVAVCDAIYKYCGVQTDIKWVNDLQINGRKICGILTETSLCGGSISYVIVGIGINVNTKAEDFPPEIQDIATSLFAETGKTYDIDKLLVSIVQELRKITENTNSDYYLHSYVNRNIIPGNSIRIITPLGEKNGEALCINDDFSLKVRMENGTEEDLASSEVSIRKR